MQAHSRRRRLRKGGWIAERGAAEVDDVYAAEFRFDVVAVTFDPAKSTGLDGALRTLANRAYGPWLLGALALGLIAFGIYGLAAARWAKT